MNKIKFLFYNTDDCFESIAQRIKEEGYQIYFYRCKKEPEHIGKNIFTEEELIDDFFEILNKEDKENLIICVDGNGDGDMMDYLRKDGWKILGGSHFADEIEYKRELGKKLMEKIGLNIPNTITFNSIEKGIKFVEKQSDEIRFVFKPDGQFCAGSAKTYTSKNKQDLIDYMKWIIGDQRDHHYEIESFELQEFIEGIEADFSSYFDGDKFMEGSINLYMEEKKSMDGNKGEALGCAGNVNFYIQKSKYYDNYLKKLEPILKKFGYIGQISINNIFSNKDGKPYGLELTPRMGWDAQLTEMEILKDSGLKISDFYISIIDKKSFNFPHDLIGCGVNVSTGSPTMKKDEVSGRYFSFDKSIENNLWFYSVSKTDEGYIIEDNPVLVCNSTGKTIKKSIDSCYEIIKKVNIPDIAYRMEIGKRCEDVIKFLNKYGWI